jgi:hypothetical protein
MLIPALMLLSLCACGGDLYSDRTQQPAAAPGPAPVPGDSAQPVRVMYEFVESQVSNLYIHDLTQARRVSSFTADSTTFLGFSRASTNGRTIVFEEAARPNFFYQVQKLWTAPTDGSSAARPVTPDLQPGQVLTIHSAVSPDGRWIVYGVRDGSLGPETLYLADLLPGGTARPIPLPAGATSFLTGGDFFMFGPRSQYLYFTANFPTGVASYRVAPGGNLAAAVRISPEPVGGRMSAVRLVSPDESRVVQSSFENGVPSVDSLYLNNPDALTRISHAFAPTEFYFLLSSDMALSRIVYFVTDNPGNLTSVDLYWANVFAGGSAVRSVRLDDLTLNSIDISISADGILLGNLRPTGNSTFAHDLLEINVNTGAVRTLRTQAPLDVSAIPRARYVDNDSAIAYGNDTGIVIFPRGAGREERIFDKPAVFFDVSPDSRTFAILTSPEAGEPYNVWIAGRTSQPPLQITGVGNPLGEALWMEIVPVN